MALGRVWQPGQTEGGGASTATRPPPPRLHPSPPGPLPGLIGLRSWRLQVASRLALAHLLSPQRPTTRPGSPRDPREQGPHTPLLRALVRAARQAEAGPGAGTPPEPAPPPRGTLDCILARGHSMGRHCWRRRVLAAACLGAALLLLGAAPRALSPGECPLG